jgi:hypothetical protein
MLKTANLAKIMQQALIALDNTFKVSLFVSIILIPSAN